VFENVRCDALESSSFASGSETFLDIADARTVVVENVA